MYEPVAQLASEFFAIRQPEARRVFHGRGQLYPSLAHLSIDWYPPVLLITSYEPFETGRELITTLQDADRLGQIKTILLQSRHEKGAPSKALCGEKCPSCIVEENGLRYEVQPGVNQNAGLFLDMRELRRWLVDNARDRVVLNLFAYTCTLSVAAIAGGAKQVTNVDMSKPSINWGLRNHELNGQDPRNIKSIPHNIFRSWGRIRQFGRYDLVIIDPPSRQRGSFDVEKNYPAVLKKLNQLTSSGADVIATVNSPYLSQDYLTNLVSRYAPQYRFEEMIPRSPEFVDKYPDKALKIYRFRAP